MEKTPENVGLRSLINLFRPLEIALFSIFPMAGYVINYSSLPPWQLVAASIVLCSAITTDNYIEGFLTNPLDARSGDYPVFFEKRHLRSIKIICNLLVVCFFVMTISFSSSTYAFIFGLVTYFVIRFYNNRYIMAKAHPPLGFLSHFFGALVYYLFGYFWGPHNQNIILFPGLGLAMVFSGGYLNHLLIDKNRDEILNIRTLAHRIKPIYIRIASGLFITSGDFMIGSFLFKDVKEMSFILFLMALLSFLATAFVKNATVFRFFYRLVHIVGGIGLVVIFLLQ